MLTKLRSMFSSQKLPQTLTPEDEQSILEKGDDGARLALASRTDARPEVLYYLAQDKSPDVRKAIAGNHSTPAHADAQLSRDVDDTVRQELARKIARLLPDMDKNSQTALREKTIAVLEDLARDQLPKIRAIVAQEIKASPSVSKDIIKQLASDIEDLVAVPILEYSPLLGDDDLREVIAAGVSSDRLSAIAKRPFVSEIVSADLTATLDIPTISALLANNDAQIREDTLDQIINQAEGVEGLHRPVAMRPQLSVRAMKRIAGFVASSLVHQMMDNSDLGEEQAEDILERVRERISKAKIGDEEEAQLAKKAQEFYRRGMLDDAFVVDQIEKNNRELLIQCLALMSDIPVVNIRKIIRSKSGRAVTALAWKAELLMRTAYELQTRFALVPSAQLLLGKDGNKYPIDEGELNWHLSYFTE